VGKTSEVAMRFLLSMFFVLAVTGCKGSIPFLVQSTPTPLPTATPDDAAKARYYLNQRLVEIDAMGAASKLLVSQFQKLDANNDLFFDSDWKRQTREPVVTIRGVATRFKTPMPIPPDLAELDGQFASLGEDLTAFCDDMTQAIDAESILPLLRVAPRMRVMTGKIENIGPAMRDARAKYP
jgi:hypothetical protein